MIKNTAFQPLILRLTATFLTVVLVQACSNSTLKKPEIKPTKLAKLSVNQQPLVPKWSYNLGGGDRKDPLRLEMTKLRIDDSQGGRVVYAAASRAGDVVVLNEQGRRIWSKKLDNDITSAMAANANTLVVVDKKARVHALNPIDGSLVWRKQLSGAVLAPALVSAKTIVLSANDGVITGLDSDTGQTRWNFSINLPSFSLRGTAKPVYLAKNFAVVAGADGRVHAMRTDTGIPLWARRVGISNGSSDFDRLNDVDADPVFYQFALYTASFQGQVVGVDMNTRKEMFQIPVSSTKTPGVDNTQLYVVTTDGKLNAYDRLTGASVWSLAALKHRQLSNPIAVDDTYVIVGDLEGYLHIVDAAAGKIIGRVRTAGAVTTLTYQDNELLVQTTKGTLSAWQVK